MCLTTPECFGTRWLLVADALDASRESTEAVVSKGPRLRAEAVRLMGRRGERCAIAKVIGRTTAGM